MSTNVNILNRTSTALIQHAGVAGPTGPTGPTGPAGGYSLPVGGIPKTDLAAAVQTSLGLADASIQNGSPINWNVSVDNYGPLVSVVNTGTNNLGTVFKYTPSVQANTMPWEHHFSGGTFGGEYDPVSYMGWNAGNSVLTQPIMRWVIESNYRNGTHNDFECYWEFIGLNRAISVRPIGYYVDKAAVSGTVVIEGGTNFQGVPGAAHIIGFSSNGNAQGTQLSYYGDRWISIGSQFEATHTYYPSTSVFTFLRQTVTVTAGGVVRQRTCADGKHKWFTTLIWPENDYECLSYIGAVGSCNFIAESGGIGSANIDITFAAKGTGTIKAQSPVTPLSAVLASLPSASTVPAGSFAYASNGRKAGEGAAAGTGIPVWSNGTNWRTYYDNSAAAA